MNIKASPEFRAINKQTPEHTILTENKVEKEIESTISHIREVTGMNKGCNLELIVEDGMKKLLIAVEIQHLALKELKKLTDVEFSSVNMLCIKTINLKKYGKLPMVAHHMQTVLQAEAQKLLATSDLITNATKNLSDCDPQIIELLGTTPELVGEKIAGKVIRGAIWAYSSQSDNSIGFLVDSSPADAHKKHVLPLIKKITPHLELSSEVS